MAGTTQTRGGAPLRWWNPEENGALCGNMLRQLADYDLHPKGILWYQGEAEGYENGAETYLDRFSQGRAAVGAHDDADGIAQLPL